MIAGSRKTNGLRFDVRVRLTHEMFKRLDNYCLANKLTTSKALRKLIEKGLKNDPIS